MLYLNLEKHVIISDLEKAFLQVGLKPCDRNTTCFLWLKDPYGPVTKDNLLTLRFTRVAFGIISSAYLLAAVITHHLKKYGTPLSWEILKSIYIDNVLFAADTTEEAIAKFHESIQLFKTAKMNLRDHISNSPELNQYFSQHQRIPNGPHKILGIPWDIVTDSLIMKSLKMPENIAKWTKRNVLKTIAQAFDPLGFLSPVHLKGKIFFQSLWKKSYSWDQPLDDVDKEIWLNILTETCGATVCIPRHLLKNSQNAQNAKFELHVFVDASKYAYAVACYLKIIANDSTTTMLIFSKSRLTPSKGLSIPKLRTPWIIYWLSNTAKFIIKEMNYNFDQVYFWTDFALRYLLD
uniref:Reverse transcriptase domain-containing protein n=1 Tax=Panagrolaimus superbus TaxID=310955 RepID=A0A914YY69_9BILA